MAKDEFENEIAILLSKFDNIEGIFYAQKTKIQSFQNELKGLKYEKEKLLNEIENLKKYNSRILKENQLFKEKTAENERLSSQNFNLSNKITSIVKDIENKELDTEGLHKLLDLMIKEIDICIVELNK